MSDKSLPVAERLRAACTGHPSAKIPWPHRLLHEAADEIERLTLKLDRLQGEFRGAEDEIKYQERLRKQAESRLDRVHKHCQCFPTCDEDVGLDDLDANAPSNEKEPAVEKRGHGDYPPRDCCGSWHLGRANGPQCALPDGYPESAEEERGPVCDDEAQFDNAIFNCDLPKGHRGPHRVSDDKGLWEWGQVLTAVSEDRFPMCEKHKRFPCRECGIRHYDGCMCPYCTPVGSHLKAADLSEQEEKP